MKMTTAQHILNSCQKSENWSKIKTSAIRVIISAIWEVQIVFEQLHLWTKNE